MASQLKKAGSEHRDADGTEDSEIKDASVAIAKFSTAVSTITDLAVAQKTELKDVRSTLGEAATAFQDMQTFLQSNSNTSMIIRDTIIGDVLQGPKPVLEPIPEAKSLPDGFRYKPNLADPSGQALHFEQCIDQVHDLSEKQVRKIIKTLHKKYVSLPYQHRPSWRYSKSPLKFDGDFDDKDALKVWVNDWKLVNKCIDNNMKAEIMMALLTSMAESQLHDIYSQWPKQVSHAQSGSRLLTSL